MDDTSEFVEKIKEDQEKARKNLRQNGKGNEAAKLSNKQHSTNK